MMVMLCIVVGLIAVALLIGTIIRDAGTKSPDRSQPSGDHPFDHDRPYRRGPKG